MAEQRWNLLIEKDHIDRTRIGSDDAPTLSDGEIEVALRRFALTANNITYAVLGRSLGSFTDMPGYWAFFPAAHEGEGRLPVWGLAEITASRCEELPVGELLYGFFPLGSHVVMQPTGISRRSFVDATAHRVNLGFVYNEYLRVSAVRGFREDEADLWPVFRPLLATGFMIADQFADNDYYGVDQVVVGSASSKTAMMTARCFKMLERPPKLIGLTSTKNAAFVSESGLCADVVTYDQLETIPRDAPTAFVDMAGNGPITERVHAHFADNLRFSLMVGMSHWDADRARSSLQGPEVVPFFAPGRIKKRAKDWGGAGLGQRLNQAWDNFADTARSLTEVRVKPGAKQAQQAYRAMLGGDIDPRVSTIIELA